MKKEHVEQVRQLATDLTESMPKNLMVNGKGDIYQDGNQISSLDLIAQIDDANDKAEELKDILHTELKARGEG